MSQTNEKSSAADVLADCQAEALVVRKATDLYDEEPDAKILIDLLDKDRQNILDKDELIELTDHYQKALCKLLGQCRVVATTLNASADKSLKTSFAPYALLCDEAEQCFESDTLIPMTEYLSLRTVVLIGDSHHLSPTVVSSVENEGAT